MVMPPEIESGEKANESVIVPIEIFLNAISEKTGRSPEDLLSKTTIGKIEKQLGIKAHKPNQLKTIKRGKSRSDLYNFISSGARRWNRDLVSALIKK